MSGVMHGTIATGSARRLTGWVDYWLVLGED